MSCLKDPTICDGNTTYLDLTNTTDSKGEVVYDLDHCRIDVVNIADKSVAELNVAIEQEVDLLTGCRMKKEALLENAYREIDVRRGTSATSEFR